MYSEVLIIICLGFCCEIDLMLLKRVSKQNSSKTGQAGSSGGLAGVSGGGKTNAFIATQSGGLCFDFSPNDSNMYSPLFLLSIHRVYANISSSFSYVRYVVGTEDGHIHRCSCSYNEQYLSSQFGHTGPVYKVKFSPFLPNFFISSSADWTVRLWGVEDEEATFKFQSGKVWCLFLKIKKFLKNLQPIHNKIGCHQ